MKSIATDDQLTHGVPVFKLFIIQPLSLYNLWNKYTCRCRWLEYGMILEFDSSRTLHTHRLGCTVVGLRCREGGRLAFKKSQIHV